MAVLAPWCFFDLVSDDVAPKPLMFGATWIFIYLFKFLQVFLAFLNWKKLKKKTHLNTFLFSNTFIPLLKISAITTQPQHTMATVTSNADTVAKAVDSLLKWRKSRLETEKPKLFDEDEEFVYLIVTLKKIPSKYAEEREGAVFGEAVF
jgi:hypothetical protein